MNFDQFAKLVRAKWEKMKKREVFIIDADKDQIWSVYLASFPEGSNPIFRERTEHDCNCCKAFIRNIGNTVIIKDDLTLDSVWNLDGLSSPYKEVAEALHAHVTQFPVRTIYRTVEAKYGTESNIELGKDGGKNITWNHFSGETHALRSHQPGKLMGEHQTNVGVMRRSLEELSADSVMTVLDLIADNNLYRGSENKTKLENFLAMHRHYKELPQEKRANYLNLTMQKNISFSLIRNTAIGTLLIDLSEGKPLEVAVKSYEDKVSGTNYKRPKALITSGMLKSADKTLTELGLQDSLARRHANISDVNVNDVLWASGVAQTLMAGNPLMELLGDQVKAKKIVGAGSEIGIDDFMKLVLPRATAVEIQLENKHRSHLVNITTGANAGAPSLFAWDSPFGWSYEGNVADSVITQRVKAAGGKVEGKLRVSLAWNNRDDLDLHGYTPDGNHVYFGNRRCGGGDLDIDANGMGGMMSEPVENMVFGLLKDGTYKFRVDQYSRRQTSDVGFTLEVASALGVSHYSLDKNTTVDSAIVVTVKGGEVVAVAHAKALSGQAMSQDLWGMKTNDFVPVQTIMLSPNHWGSKAVGNKHHFFLLEGAKNPEPTRGIYNEFLKPELNQHRKVFEVLGSKTVVQPAAEQLAGLGFSSTLRAEANVRVTTAEGKRIYNVKF